MDEPTFRNMLRPFDPTESEEDKGEEEEEATQPRVGEAPVRPNQEEVEQHMTTHLPFRSWCPHCVRGKSGSKPHKKDQGMHEMPTVAVEYMFMHSQQHEQGERGI